MDTTLLIIFGALYAVHAALSTSGALPRVFNLPTTLAFTFAGFLANVGLVMWFDSYAFAVGMVALQALLVALECWMAVSLHRARTA